MTNPTSIADDKSVQLTALQERIRLLEEALRQRDDACRRQLDEVREIREELALRDRALQLSDEAVAIFDVRVPEFPLVYVNAGFERQTGYARDEVLGKSARFIHGPDTDMETVERIREALRTGTDVATDLLSYKKDGTAYWNRVTLTPLPDEHGATTHFVAVQTDITGHVLSTQEIHQALELLERTNVELTRHVKRMKRNLEAAARVQQAMLPERLPKAKGIRFAWRYVPTDELAGDILNVFRLDPTHIGVYLLDVSGHGTAAALLAVSVARMLSPQAHASSLVREHDHDDEGCEDLIVSPAEVAARLNRQFPWDPDTGQFFTLIYGILDTESREFRYVSAGHPAPLLFEGDRPIATPESRSFPIGLGDGVYEEFVITLLPGQRIFLYSDGATDVMASDRTLFGRHRLVDALRCSALEPVDDCLDTLLRQLETWQKSTRFKDDVSLMGIEVLP